MCSMGGEFTVDAVTCTTIELFLYRLFISIVFNINELGLSCSVEIVAIYIL